MGSRFIRKVRTASGAIAVQIVEKNGRTVTGIEHLGSANTDQDLAVLLAAAKERLLPGQDTLDFNVEQTPAAIDDVPNWTAQKLPVKAETVGRPRSTPVDADAKVIASPATILWEILEAAYDRLGLALEMVEFGRRVLGLNHQNVHRNCLKELVCGQAHTALIKPCEHGLLLVGN